MALGHDLPVDDEAPAPPRLWNRPLVLVGVAAVVLVVAAGSVAIGTAGVGAWWALGGEDGPPVVADASPARVAAAPPPAAKAGTVVTGKLGYRMVTIPAGTFTMGCTPGAGECYDREKPPHEVTISRAFLLGETEVTQGLWRRVMDNENPSRFSSCGDDCPVENVSWVDSAKFANALSKLEGLEECYRVSGDTVTWPRGLSCAGYRLPTEAEWERAARAGGDTLYAGGVDLEAVGWVGSNSDDKTHRVGGLDANAWGLHDMTGNVWEWTWDGYEEYRSGAVTDPTGDDGGSYRVGRGGSWNRDAGSARAAYRGDWAPGGRGGFLGFRLARSAP